jgi:hypothetical protein
MNKSSKKETHEGKRDILVCWVQEIRADENDAVFKVK